MKGFPAVGGFVLGLALAGGATLALAQGGLDRGKGGPPESETGPARTTWSMAEVDEGAVRATTKVVRDGVIYTWDSTTKNDPERFKLLGDATTARVQELKIGLLNRGYEPYAASVYKDEYFTNEYCWFFRKRND